MDRELTPSESLKVIEGMISQTKQSVFRMGFFFLLWGAVLEACGIGEFILQRTGYAMPWIVWPVLCTLGGIVAALYGSKEGSRAGVSTFTDRVMMWLWISFAITLVLVIVGLVSIHRDPGSVVMLLTGLPTFITGALLRFRPLVIGGILFWAIGLFSFWYLLEYRSLVFAFAIVVGYAIPGALLKRQEDALRAA